MKDPLRKMERIEYLFTAILMLTVFCLGFLQLPGPRKESYLVFYADFIFRESENWVGYIVVFLFLGLSTASITDWTKLAGLRKKIVSGASYMNLMLKARHIPKYSLDLLRLVFPVILNLFLFSYVVGYINAANWNRLIDPTLASLDYSVTGSYLFLKLGMIRFPGWLVKTIEFSFINLPLFLVLAAIITFVRDKRVYAKYVVAFFTSIILMIPIWLLVPVMSPQDRFIDNVYHVKDPPQIAASLERYSPVPEVRIFLKQMRESKKGLDVMPTTTFPSSHAAWATIAFIFILEASLLAGGLFAPFLFLSTVGTFYLAQHYFVDAPAGIIIGVVSAILSALLFREPNRKSAGQNQ